MGHPRNLLSQIKVKHFWKMSYLLTYFQTHAQQNTCSDYGTTVNCRRDQTLVMQGVPPLTIPISNGPWPNTLGRHQIGNSTVYSTACPGSQQRNDTSTVSLALSWGESLDDWYIHQQRPVVWKVSSFYGASIYDNMSKRFLWPRWLNAICSFDHD